MPTRRFSWLSAIIVSGIAIVMTVTSFAQTQTPPTISAPNINRTVPVKIETFNRPQVAGSGPLTPNQSGISEAVWRGLSWPQLKQIAAQLAPPQKPWPSLQRQVVLLASTATTPPAQVDDPLPFVLTRAQWLIERGAIQQAAALLSGPINDYVDDHAWRLRSDVALASNQSDVACDLIRDGVKNFTTAYWTQANMLCDFITNNRNAAALTLKVMSEQQVPQTYFEQLASALLSDRTLSPPSGYSLSLLEWALMNQSDVKVGSELLNNASPLVLYHALTSAKSSPRVRLVAAEALSLLGGLDAGQLAYYYQQLDLSDSERAQLVQSPPSSASALSRGALWQSIHAATTSVEQRLLLLQQLDAHGRAAGALSSVIQIMMADQLASIPATLNHVQHVGWILPTLLVGQEQQAAEAWIVLLRQAVATQSIPATVSAPLWAMVQVYFADQPMSGAQQTQFDQEWTQWTTLIAIQPTLIQLAPRVLMVLQHLGRTTSAAAMILTQPRLDQLDQSSKTQQSMAAPVLANAALPQALSILTASTLPRDMNSSMVEATVAVLKRSSLHRQARQLAVEWIVDAAAVQTQP